MEEKGINVLSLYLHISNKILILLKNNSEWAK